MVLKGLTLSLLLNKHTNNIWITQAFSQLFLKKFSQDSHVSKAKGAALVIFPSYSASHPPLKIRKINENSKFST
jgi:hypothetical protein